MKLTRAGEYGVRCVLYLAKQQNGRIVSRSEIAQAMEIPVQFLGKIAQQLAHKGIIEIIQGSRGGCRLVVQAKDVALLDVIEAVEGEIFFNDCLIRPGDCNRSPTCSVHQVWQKARKQFRDTLRKATFSELIKEEDRCGF